MAVIHNGGRVRRAQAIANTPLYAVFSSSAGLTESNSLDLANAVSACRVNKQYLLKALSAAPTNQSIHYVTLGGSYYQVFSASETYGSLNQNNAYTLLVEVEISSSTVLITPSSSTPITAIFLVSGLERFKATTSGGLNIISNDVITSALGDSSQPIAIEAAHVLAAPVTPSASSAVYLQFLLEF